MQQLFNRPHHAIGCSHHRVDALEHLLEQLLFGLTPTHGDVRHRQAPSITGLTIQHNAIAPIGLHLTVADQKAQGGVGLTLQHRWRIKPLHGTPEPVALTGVGNEATFCPR